MLRPLVLELPCGTPAVLCCYLTLVMPVGVGLKGLNSESVQGHTPQAKTLSDTGARTRGMEEWGLGERVQNLRQGQTIILLMAMKPLKA